MNFQFAKFQDSAATVAGRVDITATDLAGQGARAAVASRGGEEAVGEEKSSGQRGREAEWATHYD